MASIFKRLFSSGGAQAATLQVEEPAADVAAAEKLLAEQGLGASSGEQPPSEEELKEFLIKNFLEDSSADRTVNPQVVFPQHAPATLAEILDLPAGEDELSASMLSAETAAQYPDSLRGPETVATANLEADGREASSTLEAELARKSLAEIYGMPSGAFVADTVREAQLDSDARGPALNQDEPAARVLPPTL